MLISASTDQKSTQKLQHARKTKRKTHDFQNDGVIKPKIKCVEKIIESRNILSAQNYDEVRHFKVLGKLLNLNARNYYEVLDFTKMKPEVCDPPVLRQFSIDQLHSSIDGERLKIVSLPFSTC